MRQKTLSCTNDALQSFVPTQVGIADAYLMPRRRRSGTPGPHNIMRKVWCVQASRQRSARLVARCDSMFWCPAPLLVSSL